MKWLHVVGARPNFMKIAPILRAARSMVPEIEQVLIHTGQHYDQSMSGVFFQELQIPAPDENLGIGGGSHAEQTARIMLAFEPVLIKHRPDWLVVVGDVNSTLACTLVAAKLGIKIAHVESGLRSRDMTMPEEVNRILTDAISTRLLTPSHDADENLLKEGIHESRIRRVGNVMIDTLVHTLKSAVRSDVSERLGLIPGKYVLATLHRPANVDDPATLAQIMEGLQRISEEMPVVFPVHPRTHTRIKSLEIEQADSRVILVEPVGYMECVALMRNARFVVTDSGGIQEETTYLQIPCLTARANTERPVTISHGTNRLVESTADAFEHAARMVLLEESAPVRIPPLWDGHAAERIVDALIEGLRTPKSSRHLAMAD